MESISLTKRLLVAGGILVCGYIAYCILRNREEELKQQEEAEDADFIIVVDSDNLEDSKSKKQEEKVPLHTSDATHLKKTSTNLSVVKDIPTQKPIKPKVQQTLETTSKEILVVATDEIVNEIDTATVDPQKTDNVNDIEVVTPIEIQANQKELVANDDFPLQLGSKGKRVWNLKVYMLKNHGAGGIVTDDYDSLTVARVKRYLKADTVTEQLYIKLNIEGKRKKKRNATKKKY